MIDTGVQGTRSYSTRGSDKKLLADAMKKSKSSTTKGRKKTWKGCRSRWCNVEVVKVWEDEDTNTDIIIATKKNIQEVHDAERTRSSGPKSSSLAIRQKKHIIVKRKKVSKASGPTKRKTDEEE